jgi:hypothetical protein
MVTNGCAQSGCMTSGRPRRFPAGHPCPFIQGNTQRARAATCSVKRLLVLTMAPVIIPWHPIAGWGEHGGTVLLRIRRTAAKDDCIPSRATTECRSFRTAEKRRVKVHCPARRYPFRSQARRYIRDAGRHSEQRTRPHAHSRAARYLRSLG